MCGFSDFKSILRYVMTRMAHQMVAWWLVGPLINHFFLEIKNCIPSQQHRYRIKKKVIQNDLCKFLKFLPVIYTENMYG